MSMPTFNIVEKPAAPENFKVVVGPLRSIKAIVLHIMDGSLSGTDSWFANKKADVSSHYGIGHKGEIHRYVADQNIAYHAGEVVEPSWTLISQYGMDPNLYTIGIEHEGKASDTTFPAVQLEASAALVAALCAKYSIPLDSLHVIGHHEIKASKLCPAALPKSQIIAQALQYGQVT